MREKEILCHFLEHSISIEWLTDLGVPRPRDLSATYRLTEDERSALAARLVQPQQEKARACRDAGVDPTYARYLLAREEAMCFPRSPDLNQVFRSILKATLVDDKPPKLTVGFSPAMCWAKSLQIHLEDAHLCVYYATQVRKMLAHSPIWVRVLLDAGWSEEEVALSGFVVEGFPRHKTLMLKEHKFLESPYEREEAWAVIQAAVRVLQVSSTAPCRAYALKWEQDLFLLFHGKVEFGSLSRTEANRIHQRNSRLRTRILQVLSSAENLLSGKNVDTEQGRLLGEYCPNIDLGLIQKTKIFLEYALRARKEKS